MDGWRGRLDDERGWAGNYSWAVRGDVQGMCVKALDWPWLMAAVGMRMEESLGSLSHGLSSIPKISSSISSSFSSISSVLVVFLVVLVLSRSSSSSKSSISRCK